MGLFDWMKRDDEDEEQPAEPEPADHTPEEDGEVGPPVSAATPESQEARRKQLLRDRLLNKYKAAADDTDVKAAQSRADRFKGAGDIAGGLGKMLMARATARTGRQLDTSGFTGIGTDAQAKADKAGADRKERMSNVLMEDKLEQTGVDRERETEQYDRKKSLQGREDTEWGWKSDANDPNAVVARQARKIIAKQHGLNEADLEGMSFQQLKELNLKAKEAKQKGFQFKAVQTPDGKIEWFAADPDTGRMHPTGNKTGFKLGFDATTGTQYSGSELGSDAVDVIAPGGGRLSDHRTGIEGARAHARKVGSEQGKAEQEVKVAEAAVAGTEQFSKQMDALYDEASEETTLGLPHTGAITGKVAEKVAGAGFDMGPATNRAVTEMNRQGAQYIKEMTGLTSNEKEYERLLATMPTIGKDKGAYQAAMASWIEDVKRTAEKKRKIAGQTQSRQQSTETAPPPAKTGEVKRKTKDGRTAVFNAETKEFLRYED